MSTLFVSNLVTRADLLACSSPTDRERIAAEINARHRAHMVQLFESCQKDIYQLASGQTHEKALNERDDALAEVERLKLDNAILNGRLIERTDCMLTRQRESLDEARKARSIARRALEYIDSLADLFTQLSKDRRHTSKDREAVAKCADRVRENADVIRSDLAAAGL